MNFNPFSNPFNKSLFSDAGNLYSSSIQDAGTAPPPAENNFLLLDGTNFLLLDGTDFLLLGS